MTWRIKCSAGIYLDMIEHRDQVNSLKNSLPRLLRQISPRRRGQLTLVFLLSLLGALAEMATLGAVLPFLSILAGTQSNNACHYSNIICDMSPAEISLGFASIIIVAMAVRLLLLWAGTRFAYALGADLGHEVYRRTLYQPYRFHAERNSSQIIAAVNKINQLVTAVIVPMIQGTVAIVIVIAILAALLRVDVLTAVVAMTSLAVFYIAISTVTRKALRRNSKIISRTEVGRVQALQEGLGGIRDILLEGSQEMYVRRFDRVTIEQRQAQATNLFIRNTPRYIIEAVGMIMMIALAWWIQERQGLAAALPTLGAMALGAQRMLPQLQLAYYGWSSLNANKAVIDDVMELLLLPIQENDAKPRHKAAYETDKKNTPIIVKNLSFSYHPEAAPVLNNIQLEIAAGSRIGFIGKTGSGKSTLIDLIMGLLDPSSGEILVEGESLNAANRRSWQSRIAHVPQSIYLSDSSLAENIAFGIEKNKIDPDRVAQAAERAQLASFIANLPDKYATLVGERGVRLSGGQRQRIGLARAFYKQADILVLDEATSALDDTTEAAVMDGINGLGSEVTVLMIAHRLTTLRMCNLVIELNEGSIVRTGSYHDLIEI